MILPPLILHLAVCAMSEVQRFLDMDKSFWHLISIRDTTMPKLQFHHARDIHPYFFDDVEITEEGSGGIVISPAQAADIWRQVDADPTAPLLVHCVAGLSRSTAVVASIIARALLEAGMSIARIGTETADRLLAIRPPASPNGMVILRMLEHILATDHARQIAQGIWEDGRIIHNRLVRSH